MPQLFVPQMGQGLVDPPLLLSIQFRSLSR